jgi:hypothetical protein
VTPFGRRRRDARDESANDAPAIDAPAEPAADSPPARTSGPWDVAERPELGARLDLGALRVPGRQGMQLRMEMDREGGRVVAANVALAGSALQVQAFAAPRTTGIWDELRAEIAASITSQGGTVEEVTGPFGQELAALLPVRTPEGRASHRPARFLGIDGPRWFVRAVLTGRAAQEPEAARELESVIADVVVVRGAEAMAPRELLPLHLPGKTPAPPPPPGPGGIDPLRRGPEITEVR